MISRKLKRLGLLVVVLTSCSSDKGKIAHLVKLKQFSIQIDSVYNPIVLMESPDGNSGKLLFNEDTIFFNIGFNISNLAEKDISVIYFPYNQDSLRKHLDTSLVNPDEIVYTNKINADIDEFRKQNVFFKKISGFNAKITVPRKEKNGGMTGVYIDSLRINDEGRLKFNLYAKNLDSAQSRRLVSSFKTISFHLQ